MTKEEFMEETRGWFWPDFIAFCDDEGYYDITENIYTRGAFDDYIDETVQDWDDDWHSLMETLIKYDTVIDSADYFRKDDWGDFTPLDEDSLTCEIAELVELLEDNGFFTYDNDSDDDDETSESVDDGDPKVVPTDYVFTLDDILNLHSVKN